MSELRLDRFLRVPKGLFPDAAKKRLLASLVVGADRIALGKEEPSGDLVLPRRLSLGHTYVDERPVPELLGPQPSSIVLDHRMVEGVAVPTGGSLQQDALRALLQEGLGGVLQLYCGAGKTVIAIQYLAITGRRAVIVVPSVDGIRQWMDAFNRFLDEPKVAEARGAAGMRALRSADYVVTTFATLARLAELPEWDALQRRFATVFFDEAHHASAPLYAAGASAFSGKRFGLTATPERQDGLDVIQQVHIGPTLFCNLQSPLRAKVVFLRTLHVALVGNTSSPREEAGLAAEMGRAPSRLRKLSKQVQLLLVEGRKVLVLSRSLTSLVNLLLVLRGEPPMALEDEAIRGAVAREALEGAPDIGFLSAEVPPGYHRKRAQLMFAYWGYGKEAYDDEALDTVVMLEPTTDPGMLQQVLGRPCRIYPKKKPPQVLVVEDLGVPVYAKRCAAMRTLLNRWPEAAGGKVNYERRDL